MQRRGAVSRRDVLKLSGAVAGLGALNQVFPRLRPESVLGRPPNLIVLVWDAMSAANMSLYGYPRHTTANFEKFADGAAVYHRHYASGNFTTSGTASLLTGMGPWTHRAINASGLVRADLARRNLFGLLGDGFHRMAFTQNYWADYLLNQFSQDLDQHLPLASFGLVEDKVIDQAFRDDALLAYRSYATTFFPWISEQPSSLLLSFFYNLFYQARVRRLTPPDYPLGLPSSNTLHYVFTLEDVVDGLIGEVDVLERRGSPFAAYIHLWPPHDPYRPRKDFLHRFEGDGHSPVSKPQHSLSTDFSDAGLLDHRREYDEYLAQTDMEFGRLMQQLEGMGILENTCIVVTSDHGEMFERGVLGHFTPLLYEPIMRVPLLVSTPGQRQRIDIYTPTSATDLVPTLLRLLGRPQPDWLEGRILPGMGGENDAERSVFCVDAKENGANRPLSKVTVALIKGRFKLMYYAGYKGRYAEYSELYDLEDDPEELRNIVAAPKAAAALAVMQREISDLLARADLPYRRAV